MRELRTSGSVSRRWKRSVLTPPRHLSTLPLEFPDGDRKKLPGEPAAHVDFDDGIPGF